VKRTELMTLMWRVLRPSVRSMGTAIALAFYIVSRAEFVAMSRDGGLLTPDGSVSVPFAALGAAVMVERIVLLFVLLPLFVYRLVATWLEAKP
jgi:hypothetical protein